MSTWKNAYATFAYCVCLNCGAEFFTPAHEVQRGGGRYCKPLCYHAARNGGGLRAFWERVDKSDPDGCWLWTRAHERLGYGQVRINTRLRKAHHVALELSGTPVPDGAHVMHHCDNPPCVRPDHLSVATRAENMADMVAKRRSGGARFPETFRETGLRNIHHLTDHPKRGSDHHNSKLSEAQVIGARKLHAEGVTGAALARRFGVTQSTMSSILLRKTWRHIDQ